MPTTAGKGSEMLGEHCANCLLAVGNHLYYTIPRDNANGGEIHRMDTDGSHDVKLSSDDFICETIIPCGGYLFFISAEEIQSRMCVLNLETAEATVLYTGQVSDVNYCGGALWFVRRLGEICEICRVAYGTDEIEPLGQAADITNLIVNDEYVYYLAGENDDRQIFRMRIDGTDVQMLYHDKKAPVNRFVLTEGKLYFCSYESPCMHCFTPGDSDVQTLPGLQK